METITGCTQKTVLLTMNKLHHLKNIKKGLGPVAWSFLDTGIGKVITFSLSLKTLYQLFHTSLGQMLLK